MTNIVRFFLFAILVSIVGMGVREAYGKLYMIRTAPKTDQTLDTAWASIKSTIPETAGEYDAEDAEKHKAANRRAALLEDEDRYLSTLDPNPTGV